MYLIILSDSGCWDGVEDSGEEHVGRNVEPSSLMAPAGTLLGHISIPSSK